MTNPKQDSNQNPIHNEQSVFRVDHKPGQYLRFLLAKMRVAGFNLPKPANDNVGEENKEYSKASRDHAGLPYQPVSTKMWWLP